MDILLGFLEKEIRKDGIPMLDTGENPDAPAPREMIDLEVGWLPKTGSGEAQLLYETERCSDDRLIFLKRDRY